MHQHLLPKEPMIDATPRPSSNQINKKISLPRRRKRETAYCRR